MNPDERALLAAVLAEPACDAPRLVYADWLEERGGPGDAARAAFVRVQCRIADLDRELLSEEDCEHPNCSGCRERRELRRRESELLLAHACAWTPGELVAVVPVVVVPFAEVWLSLPGPAGHMAGHFRRGFLAELACTLADWLAHGPALVRAAPLTRVRLSDVRPWNAFRRRWGWTLDPDDFPDVPWCVPVPLFRELPPTDKGLPVFANRRWYRTEDAAHAALSAACLAWAKAPPHRATPPPDRR